MFNKSEHSSIPWKKLILLLAVILAVLLVLICAFLLPFSLQAKQSGLAAGEKMGTLAGRAVGSYQGFTKGRIEGAEAGRAQGLSAEDIEIEVQQALTRTGKLQVLAGKVTLEDLRTVGEGKYETYRALRLLRGDVTFTVDLQKAVVTTTPDTVMVHLPDPEPELTIDENESKIVKEYHRKLFGAEDVDGFTAALNSMQVIKGDALANIANADDLVEQARAAAVEQSTLLAQSICGANRHVTVTVGNAEEESK